MERNWEKEVFELCGNTEKYYIYPDTRSLMVDMSIEIARLNTLNEETYELWNKYRDRHNKEYMDMMKERDAGFTMVQIEHCATDFKMCPSCKGQMGPDDHYCNVCNHRVSCPIEVPWEFIAILKSKSDHGRK